MAERQDVLSIPQLNQQIQQQSLNWQAGDTPLSAMSLSEQRQHLGLIVSEAELQAMRANTQRLAAEEALLVGAVAAPAVKDWRNVGGANYVTPIKDQGGCGSCVSFGSCATIEANMRVKAQDASLAIDLSEAFLQFCGGGSCNGWGLTSGLDFAKSTGVTDEACFPYQDHDMACSNRCADWQSRLRKINSYTAYASMQARKDAIANVGPVLAGMAVYQDFFAYKSGVYQKTSNTLAGYHCISVVGYDDTQQCWIIKNSWGTGWGESGFGRIKYGQADLLIDSSWQFYSVDPDIQPTKGSGPAKYILVDKYFGGNNVLWAYAGNAWRYRYVPDADLPGIAKVLFEANRVDVWWDANQLTLLRPWKNL